MGESGPLSNTWFPGSHASPQPKRHLDGFSCFCKAQWCEWCDRLTDHGTWSVTIVSASVYIVLRCGLIIILTLTLLIVNACLLKMWQSWLQFLNFTYPGMIWMACYCCNAIQCLTALVSGCIWSNFEYLLTTLVELVNQYCLCICIQTVTCELNDLWPRYLTLSRSGSELKVIGHSSRSQQVRYC